MVPSIFKFRQHGESAAWVSELMPHTAKIVDRLCLIKSMHTEAINHDPAITMMHTGSERAGRPGMGAWLSYGLGTANQDLPTFVVMTSNSKKGAQPLYKRLWGSGFLPTQHQGVRFRGVGDPVLYLSNPPGMSQDTRRHILDDIARLNELKQSEFGDPEITTRIAQYELAFRMQTSVPELTDTSGEPEHIFRLYGDDARQRGTYGLTLPDGQETRRKGRALRSIVSPWLGSAPGPAEGLAGPMSGHRSSDGRTDSRSGAARTTR